MNRRLNSLAAAFVALLIFMLASPAHVRGQGVGVNRVMQKRRVGRVTLPTPPFNPDAGILGGGKARTRKAPKHARRRASQRGARAATRHTAPKSSIKGKRGG